MSRPLRTIVVLVTVATVALGMTGCQTARVGARCRTTDFGQTATQILRCKQGRWRVLMTKAQYVQLLIAIRNNTTTTTAPAPPTTTTAPLPPPPPPILPAYALSVGAWNTCAVKSDALQCIGLNDVGQFGNGTSTPSTTAWVSSGITDAVDVASALDATCVIRRDGTLWCWGNGHLSGLGIGYGLDAVQVPIRLDGLTGVTQVSMGTYGSCAVLEDHTVRCWGQPYLRGDGSTDGQIAWTPVVASISSVAKVSVGIQHACALKLDGTVWCWGHGAAGALGNGSGSNVDVPTQVSGIVDAVDIAVNDNSSSCAVHATGAVSCWGSDANNNLGDGSSAHTDRFTPNLVIGISDATRVIMNSDVSCALRSGGEILCWGNGGSGALGNGSWDESASPVPVTGITNAASLSAKGETVCAQLADHAARCWGRNDYGQLAGGFTSFGEATPVTVIGLP